MMREFGRLVRMPGSPAASSSEPIDAACPITMVATAGRMNCIVS